MIDWVSAEPALCSLFGGLSGLTCVWKDASRPFVPISNRALMTLQVFAIRSPNVESVNDAAPSDTLRERLIIEDFFTLRVEVQSFDQTPGKAARTYIATLIPRLYWESSRVALATAAGLTCYDSEATQDTSYTSDDRMVSRAFVDLKFTSTGQDTDSTVYYPIEHLGPITTPTPGT